MSSERKLSDIKGYVHPDETQTSRQPQYMSYTYNEGENMGEYNSGNGHDTYSTFSSTHATHASTQPKALFCPLCECKAMYICDCPLEDMVCKKGHTWYVLKNGMIKLENPHDDDDQ